MDNFEIKSLAEKADAYLRKNGVKKLRGAKIGPSEIASSCPRQIVLGREESAVAWAPDEKLEDVTARMEGTALHKYFQEDILPSLPGVEVIAAEKWIENEHMNGSIDGIIKDTVTGEIRVLEIKTVKQAKFNEMRDKGEPKQEYIEQMLLYMDHENIKTGEIFVINRGLFEDKKNRRFASEITESLDDEMFLSFIVSLDDKANQERLAEVKARVEVYYQLLEDHAEHGTIPEIPANASPNAFPCLWCKFKHYCWKDSYKTASISDMHSDERDDIQDIFSKYYLAKQGYMEAYAKLDKTSNDIKRYFRQHGFSYWAVKGNNFTIATDGEIMLLKGAIDIDQRVNVEEEIKKPRNAMKAKAKISSPKPGAVVPVNQCGLFDNLEPENQPADFNTTAEDFAQSVLDLMS